MYISRWCAFILCRVQHLQLSCQALLQAVSARQDGIEFFMQNDEAVQMLRKIVRTLDFCTPHAAWL